MDESLPPPIESGTLVALDTSQTRSTRAEDRHVKASTQGGPKCGHKDDSNDLDISNSDDDGCKRLECPCDTDIFLGDYCFEECRDGQPCSSRVHTPEVILARRLARCVTQKANRKRRNELRDSEYMLRRDALGLCLDECDRLLIKHVPKFPRARALSIRRAHHCRSRHTIDHHSMCQLM